MNYFRGHVRYIWLGAIVVLLVEFAIFNARPHLIAQTSAPSSHSPGADSTLATSALDRAMRTVCAEREIDPLGSAPIDKMQERPSLPLRHPDVMAAALRAERLLPVARELAAAAIYRLAREYGPRPSANRAILNKAMIGRMSAVREIKPDMELRDNASVLNSDPHAIHFGTIFLAGLPSDEGMISVLAHELTHVADGPESSLRLLFRNIARRAAQASNLHISNRRAEELVCDLVGTMAVRAYIARTPNNELLMRRMARALEHNCVETDDTDNVHLSPRSTMRALLSLDTNLTREITGEEIAVPRPLPSRGSHSAHPSPR